VAQVDKEASVFQKYGFKQGACNHKHNQYSQISTCN
jgi:hypothetical protein